LKSEPEKLLKTKDKTTLVARKRTKRTGKRSGEVVENIRGLKKRTENEPENKAGHVVENKMAAKKRSGNKL